MNLYQIRFKSIGNYLHLTLSFNPFEELNSGPTSLISTQFPHQQPTSFPHPNPIQTQQPISLLFIFSPPHFSSPFPAQRPGPISLSSAAHPFKHPQAHFVHSPQAQLPLNPIKTPQPNTNLNIPAHFFPFRRPKTFK